ncbi:Ankyrin repeat [Trinorchestia longiramus]|nr:Ankyrin repeat [Trinorchestia longiramus]
MTYHQLGRLVSEYHQLGRLVSESACERKDLGSNPAADMVDAARNTAWYLAATLDSTKENLFNPCMLWRAKEDTGDSVRQLFDELCIEVLRMKPGSRLNHILRHKLEKLPKESRQEIVNRKCQGCTPLFIACKRGLAEVVEYLCLNCGADIELKGIYEVPDDRSNHFVTPLWCAAVAGQEDVVKVLVSNGADVNSVSDTGSTSVRSACFMSHIKIVKYLVESGADVLKPNFNGGTCLINSVQSVELCKFLIDHGADINARDIKSKTALHYAIEEHRYETVKLLIERGADPFITSRLNDDALQTACIKGALQIFTYLIEELRIAKSRMADGYEVLGSTFLDEHNDMHEAILHWRTAGQIRQSAGIVKEVDQPRREFGYVREFATLNDLDNAVLDQDAIRMQSLLVCMRVLGATHKDTIYRLMIRGAAYADSLQYQRCIQLWTFALHLRIKKDTILYNEVSFNSHALVKLLLDILEKFRLEEVNQIILFEDVFRALTLIGDEIEPCMRLLSIKPKFRRQQLNFDQQLNIFVYLLCVIIRIKPSHDQMEKLVPYLTKVVRSNPMTGDDRFSLLHLSVTSTAKISSPSSGSHSKFFTGSFFPNGRVAALLLDCGADIDARSAHGCSPLFLASCSRHYKKEIVQMLIRRGAHFDQATAQGDHPGKVLAVNSDVLSGRLDLPFPPLKCLAARVIRRHRISVQPRDLPASLADFLSIH